MTTFAPHTRLWLIRERTAERIEEARNSRLPSTPRSASLRRSVGHSIIRIGERLAEEPHFRPVRTP